MKQLLVACGDVGLLKRILADLPPGHFKPVATKKGAGIAQKLVGRPVAAAIVHVHLADQATGQLLRELQTHLPELPILLLYPDQAPAGAPVTRVLRYPVPGPVFRNALQALVPPQRSSADLEQWRAFYNETKKRLELADKQSYFQLLGLNNGAPHHRIVKAFDVLSLRFHPDRYEQYTGERWGKALYDQVNTFYKLLTEAYAAISDRRLRAIYEDALQQGQLRLDPEATNMAERGPRTLDELARGPQARRFLKLAQRDLAIGNPAAALQNLQFALSMEPDNSAIEQKIAELQRS
ncbi:hypothetical protein DL240_07545 [Lujinxingia litoralis]|uniref:J domain-containing protein n=1 Tax=Lujinxingia litoralis TaxID=2211119 RepID=A0A328C7W2_9DELT|nr:DnaJ domain-containing protein [Lujinxingia litoralis]RAL22744.1 hypothetical protein DL240_07545 [Lujinxingia litoralis]